MKNRSISTSVLTSWVVAALLSTAASAQLNGHNTKGDFGLQSGSQPDPGLYVVAPLYLRYETDTVRDSNGDSVLPDVEGSLDVNAYVLGLVWVSERKILGGNYSFQIFPAWTNNNLELPLFGVAEESSTEFTDLYFQPVNLGWKTERADFTAGLGIYAPTGEYEFGADDNVGLGMWSYELFAGTTLYFDEARSWHFAATAFYEIHDEKDDTDIKVGDLLTLEGGIGKSFMEGALSVGVAYYAQWKTSRDELGEFEIDLPIEIAVGKHRIYGLGPELSLPIATKKKLIALLNLRYLWESGARSTLEGDTFVLTATFPVPSVPLQ
jgi:hypothetical protein